MAAYNIKIDTLQVKDGQVVAIGLSGGAKELMALAVGEVETAQKYIDHMQRPLARKFTSLIAKMKALQLDLEKHDQYVADLNARKDERHTNTMIRQFVNMTQGKEVAGIMGAMRDTWSQDPSIMEGR